MGRAWAIGTLATGFALAVSAGANPVAWAQIAPGSATQPPGPQALPGTAGPSGPASANVVGGYQPPERCATNRFEFTIPIIHRVTIDSLPEDQRPVENQLFLSSDRGANWTRYATEAATAENFTFAATHEGEFWFALRTKDREGRISPAGPLRAELVVTVDTTPPKLTLDAKQNDEGQLEATWAAADDRLEPKSFKIEALPPNESAWIPLTLNHPGRASLTNLEGVGKWTRNQGLSGVQLRAEIVDLAGNRTVATKTLPEGLPTPNPAPVANAAAAQPSSTPPATSPATPPANGSSVAAAEPSQGAGVGRLASSPSPTGSSFPQLLPTTGGSAPAPVPGGSLAGGLLGAGILGGAGAAAPTATGYPPPPPIGGGTGGPLASPPPIQSFAGSSLGSSVPPAAGSLPSANVPPANLPPTNLPPSSVPPLAGAPPNAASGVASQPSGAGAYPAGAGTFGAAALPTEGVRQSLLPPGERPLMTNQRTFNLEYDLDRVEPRDLHDVELWATRDGGRSWQKWGTDADVRSPFPVTVEAEGTYGFRIVVVAKNGLASPSPRSGEPADVWVGIDFKAPRARVSAAPYTDGPQAGQLRITWEAADESLGERPIGLFFSASPEGPWQSIAQGLPNAGQYFWKVDPRAPASVYLKIEVTDAAGNVGSDRTLDSIDLRGLVPSGRIRGISPVAQPSASSARSSWLPSWLQWR
ncbi:MAG TPA: hypothetical protein VGN57_07380 [Pirellulaceae bacterium]|jgi:hypothetical protein|nr:hypothetical protein [Pirellulaceae bacterium]